MTGAELKLEFERQINKSFSQYYTDAEQKELFKKALILSIEDIYKNLSAQHSYDNIDSLIKTNKTFYVNNNAICHAPISITTIVPGNPTIVNTKTTNNLVTGDFIYIDKVAGTMSAINNISYTVTVTGDKQFTIAHNSTGLIHTANTGAIVKHSGTTMYSNGFSNPKMIEDYLHLLAIQLKYYEVIQGAKIVDASDAQPIVITLSSRNNNIKTGDIIRNIGIMGLPNANGEFYVKKIGVTKYELYHDVNLLNGVVSNGKYAGGGIALRAVYKAATPYFSNAKVSPYDKPSIHEPKFERGEYFIKTMPSDQVCMEAKIDYISNDITYIDPTNTTIDLETKYSMNFIYVILNRAATLFFEETREFDSMQVSEGHEEKNKKD